MLLPNLFSNSYSDLGLSSSSYLDTILVGLSSVYACFQKLQHSQELLLDIINERQ